MTYFDGVFQRIINQIPPHAVYIEPFVGGGAILRNKRPAERSIAVDLDPGALAGLGDGVPAIPAGTELVQGDALDFLAGFPWRGGEFVYADPPYLHSTRRSRHRYRCELTDWDHLRLLDVLNTLSCPVLVSGYWSPLYLHRLRGWRRVEFTAATRGGRPAIEVLWANYPEPTALHDYRFLGDDFRARERFKRQRTRWIARLARMDRLHRQALLAALEEADPAVNGECARAGPDWPLSARRASSAYVLLADS